MMKTEHFEHIKRYSEFFYNYFTVCTILIYIKNTSYCPFKNEKIVRNFTLCIYSYFTKWNVFKNYIIIILIFTPITLNTGKIYCILVYER